MTPEVQGRICSQINQLAGKHGDKPIANKVTYCDKRVVEVNLKLDGGGCAMVPATLRAYDWPQAYGIMFLYLQTRHTELLKNEKANCPT